MATIDLGKIKLVWRGTYNNSTAYTVDDIVEYTDTGITSTYICVANSTGNAPSSGGTAHASWNYMAKGVVDPIPTQSGNDGKFLKTNGSALSFDDAGAWVKIASGTGPNVSVTSIDIDNIFSATYKFYKIFLIWTQDDYIRYRWLKTSDGSAQTGNAYDWVQVTTAENSDESVSRHGGNGETQGMITYWNATDNGAGLTEMTIQDPFGTGGYSVINAFTTTNEGGQFRIQTTSNAYTGTDSHRGIKIYGHNGDGIASTNFFYLVLGANIS